MDPLAEEESYHGASPFGTNSKLGTSQSITSKPPFSQTARPRNHDIPSIKYKNIDEPLNQVSLRRAQSPPKPTLPRRSLPKQWNATHKELNPLTSSLTGVLTVHVVQSCSQPHADMCACIPCLHQGPGVLASMASCRGKMEADMRARCLQGGRMAMGATWCCRCAFLLHCFQSATHVALNATAAVAQPYHAHVCVISRHTTLRCIMETAAALLNATLALPHCNPPCSTIWLDATPHHQSQQHRPSAAFIYICLLPDQHRQHSPLRPQPTAT